MEIIETPTGTIYNLTITDTLMLGSGVKLERVDFAPLPATTGLSADAVVVPARHAETAVETAIRRRQVVLALRHKRLNETVSAAEFIRAIPPAERQYPASRTGVADDDFAPWCDDVFPKDWDPTDR